MDVHPRLIDVVPTRPLTLVLLFVAGLAIIAGLEGLYYWMSHLAHLATDGRVAAFDLDGEGSLSGWFSSALLSLASAVALLIYSVRRHKPDDYHARYRVWLWAAGLWLVMSIDESGSLHEGFKEMMFHITGTRIFGDGSIWWVIPYSLLVSFVGLRMWLDMRGSRLARSALVLTAVSWVVAVAAQLQWIMPETGARGVMLEEGCEMLGFQFLLFGMLLHARYVIMEAQGSLPERRQRASKAEGRTAASNAAPAREAEPAPARRARAPQRDEPAKVPSASISLRTVTQPSSQRRDEAETDSGKRPLSKRERRALRRQQRGADDYDD